MMPEKRYAIYGTSTPSMLGRARVFERIRRNQTKPNPDHLSIIAPPGLGKTVLMNHIIQHFRGAGSPYLAVVNWDMRHETPTSDQDFLNRLAQHLKAALTRVEPAYAEQIADGEHAFQTLKYVVEALSGDGKMVLAVLDGFDYALANDGLTRGLFNNIRKLAEASSLCLIIASTAPLRELCSSEDTASSDFWELFGDIVVLGPLEDDDWAAMLAPLADRNVTFEKGACTEMPNWCGSHPLLAVVLLAAVDRHVADNTEVTKQSLDGIAEALIDDAEHNAPMMEVWRRCNLALREALALVPSDGKLTKLPAPGLLAQLESRGLVRKLDHGYRSSRFMERIASRNKPDLDRLRELFGEPASYQKHMRLALELRLTALSGVDERLRLAVSKAIRDLDPTPEFALGWARRIAARALEIIWKAELGDKREIPAHWTNEWKQSQKRYVPERLPSDLGPQCAILRMIVGDGTVDRLAKVVSKQSALLVNFLQSVGDFGQHQDEEVKGSFGTSVCHAAVELCETLTADLKRQIPSSTGAKS